MLTRRRFLQSATAATALAYWSPAVLASPAYAAVSGPPILINLFLRGGADGLAMVAPVGDPACSAAASNPIAFGNGMFALHPQFAPLFTSVSQSEVTGVHAVHSDDTSLSHFNAMAVSDRGNEPSGPGWMMGAALASNLLLPLNNVSLGTSVNPALYGGPSASLTGINDLIDVTNTFETILPSIERMWAGDSVAPLLVNTAGDLVSLVGDVSNFGPDNSTIDYPTGVPEGIALKEAARFIKETPSVAYIAINSGSINNGSRWDTHANQIPSLKSQIKGMSEAIAAFRQDVGDNWNRIIIVIQTEFGRTAHPNNIAMAGTQHGHATVAMMIGGPVADSPTSGEITYSDWPGIASGQLYERRYLDRTTDIRNVLGEVLEKHMLCPDIDSVFPTFDRAANPQVGFLAQAGTPGDADGSGQVDSTDVNKVLANLVGDTDTELYATLADYDRNRAVELRDAFLIAQDLEN